MENDSVPQAPIAVKTCPHCAKEIPIGAKKCPYCQSDLRSWWNRHPILTALGILFLIGFFISSIGNILNLSPDSSADDSSPAEKLARIDNQDPNPSASTVALYDALLTKLSSKCPNDSREQIAGDLVEMQKDLTEQTTILQDGETLYDTFPAKMVGVVSCADWVATSVDLANRQSGQ
jgi:hypothetical protein